MIPTDCKYTAEHEWIRPAADPGVVRVGITDYAQDALGDIVYVTLPERRASSSARGRRSARSSRRRASPTSTPRSSGTVSARNGRLDTEPELVNADPYGDGWIVEVTLAEGRGARGPARCGRLPGAARGFAELTYLDLR